MLEALDGFIIVLGTDGHILYTSESMASLLGYMPTSLHNTTLYEIVSDNDKIPLYNTLNMSASVDTCEQQQVQCSDITVVEDKQIHKKLSGKLGLSCAKLSTV